MKTVREYWPLFLIGLLAIGFAVWYFFLRKKQPGSASLPPDVVPMPSDPLVGSEVQANKDSVSMYDNSGALVKTFNKGDYIGIIVDKVNGGSLFPSKIMYRFINTTSGRTGSSSNFYWVWNQDVERITYS